MDLQLKGKNILITGGSKGIGKAIAQVFLVEGANVAIAASDREILQKAKEELGGNVVIYQADITKAAERENLIREFVQNQGKLDVLINNAGGSNGAGATETELALFYEAMELN